MAQTELERFDEETEELKIQKDEMFQGMAKVGLASFMVIALGFAVGSNADAFKDKPLSHRALRYIAVAGLLAFTGAKNAFKIEVLVKVFCAVGFWMHVAFCVIIVLHSDLETDHVPATIIISTGIVIVSIFISMIYKEHHETAKRERMRAKIILDIESGPPTTM